MVDLLQRGKIELVQGPTLSVALPNGKVLNADILQYSAPITENGKDVAVLKVPGSNYPTVPLGNSDQVRLQDTVMVMGYPGVASSFGDNPIISAESNSEASATNGHISAIKTGTIGVPLLQSDVAITHGNSGGPAFNERGEVIGIATAGAETAGIQFPRSHQHGNGIRTTNGRYTRRVAPSTSTGTPASIFTTPANITSPSGNSTMPCSSCLTLPDVKKYRASAVLAEDHLSPTQKVMETTGRLPIYAAVGILLLGAIALILRRKQPAQQSSMAVAAGASGPLPVQPSGQSLPSSNDARLPRTLMEKNYGSIQFTSGALSGRTFKVDKQGLWVGRDPKCAVPLSPTKPSPANMPGSCRWTALSC